MAADAGLRGREDGMKEMEDARHAQRIHNGSASQLAHLRCGTTERQCKQQVGD